MRFPKGKLLLTNEIGEYIFITSGNFEKLISYKLGLTDKIYKDLVSKNIINSSNEMLPYKIDQLATRYRTKKAFLRDFTSLHMVVVTLRCNHSCKYCHASSKNTSAFQYDMDVKTSKKAVDIIFRSPSPFIKIEFQGGEPLLNFNVVKEIIEYVSKLNKRFNKRLSFVLCTNLTLMDENKLRFFKDYDVLISTSLDGPKNIHDANRVMREGDSSYDKFLEKLELTRKMLGDDKVSALMTITKNNLYRLQEVIDEYIRLNFHGIFLRSLNPYGYAKSSKLHYEINDFINVYRETINYIIQQNLTGKNFVEYFASILLKRILTPFSSGFMDLQSPAGAGILGAIYNFDGSVYPSDEARMLAAMDDNHFYLGNVNENTYEEIFNNPLLRRITKSSCVEAIPGCHSCAYQQYCGSDPIRAYSLQHDKNYVGHIPTSEFCRKHMAIITLLLELVENADDDTLDVLWAWITNKHYSELKLT
jgi:His-Xaa-Ser system radical SAM maturase HxsB